MLVQDSIKFYKVDLNGQPDIVHTGYPELIVLLTLLQELLVLHGMAGAVSC